MPIQSDMSATTKDSTLTQMTNKATNINKHNQLFDLYFRDSNINISHNKPTSN